MAASRNHRCVSRRLQLFLSVGGALMLALGPAAGASVAERTLWVTRYDHHQEVAGSIAVNSDGSMVFVTGWSTGKGSGKDYATLAYDAPTGATLWVKRYNGPGNGDDVATSVAVSPDGSKVFVTGVSDGGPTNSDYATVAYDAPTGTTLWVKRYNGPGNGGDGASSAVASPDGSVVFVTGTSKGGSPSIGDYATLAYEVSTGATRWARRYSGHGNYDFASSLAVSPSGSKVFVTGTSDGGPSNSDYATVAYDDSTGAKLWVKRYDGPAGSVDSPSSIAASSDGSKVFVTGESDGALGDGDYATVAYNAFSGAKLWVRRYDGPVNRDDRASSIVASSDGSKVFVTGISNGGDASIGDFATVAYDAPTGKMLWVSRYDGPGHDVDQAESIATSPDGSNVFVTGGSVGTGTGYDYATVAYDASTGAKLWLKRYNGPANRDDFPYSVDSSPDGANIFVTGFSCGPACDFDYATVAYGP